MTALILLLACTKGSVDSGNDRDGDGYTEECDDTNPDVFPGAAEVCDGLDNDCDGLVDNGVEDAATWYVDADGDGYGAPGTGEVSCDPPVGSYSTNDWDCDDSNAATSPASYEICDGLDNDCDGTPDDDAINADTWYADVDNDGYGDPDASSTACDAPDGSVADDSDCDDSNGDVNPGESETWYDGTDSDCDGQSDYDQDGDGVDSDAHGGVDCDDTNADLWEVCALYTFTDHTFTPCGSTGRDGPLVTACRADYSTTWDADAAFLDMSARGIQLWTVPDDGDYEIEAVGAAAGDNTSYTGFPGRGAQEIGTFTLSRGQILQILVGQQGQSVPQHAGAGGGTYVVQTDGTPLIIAGGGGAACRGDDHQSTQDATSSNSGVSSTCAGGTGGGGGSSCSGSYGSGGGGLYDDGSDGPGASTGGRSFANGGAGGQCDATCGSNAGAGGFGGGGGTYHDVYGGGGGGYSGGGGGDYCNGGGGGGSYNAGASTSSATGVGTSDGWVTIIRL
jgi:hypothetical protein